MKPFVLLIAGVAALGGLLFGYDTGVISGAILFITRAFALPTHVQELTVSVVLIGAVCGSAVAGAIADRIGRHPTLLWAGIIFGIGALLSAFAANVSMLLAARVIVGVAIGLSSVIAPLYISEVAPARTRGGLVSLYQFAITVGILASFIVDYLFASSGAWRWMLGLALVPAALLVTGMLFLPESPRFLFRALRPGAARDVLRRIASPDEVIQEEAAIVESLATKRVGFEALTAPSVRSALLIGIALAVLQQVTGINAVIYYGPQIFKMAGIASDQASILATAWVGVVNVLLTLVAIFFVDSVGRKPLLYAGCAGMCVSLATLAYAFAQPVLAGSLTTITLASMLAYVGCFAFSLGPIVWLLISEIFPLGVRGLGMSICTLSNWVANFLVSRYFLTMVQKLGRPLTFSIYAALCLATIAFIAFAVPETKRKPLETIRIVA